MFHATEADLAALHPGSDGELARVRRRTQHRAQLPALLHAAGLRVLEIRPQVRTVSPRDYTWQWPKSFIEINVARLQELGRVTPEWGADVLREFTEVEADEDSWFTTPMFLEIVARKE